MFEISKYRFKTVTEFLQEYGRNWRHCVCNSPEHPYTSWVEDMDILFGKKLSGKILNLSRKCIEISDTNIGRYSCYKL